MWAPRETPTMWARLLCAWSRISDARSWHVRGRVKGLMWVLEPWPGREGMRRWYWIGKKGVVSLNSVGEEQAPWMRRMVAVVDSKAFTDW